MIAVATPEIRPPPPIATNDAGTSRISQANTPEPRTSHNISNIEIVEQRDGELDLRFNWHTLSHRYKKTDSFFGTAFYTLATNGDEPQILAKKVVLKSDYIHQVIDIYHI